MNEFQVRKYVPSDLQDCRTLWKDLTEHHRDLYNDPSIGGKTPECYFDKHLERNDPDNIWVAELEGAVVGLIGLIFDEEGAEVDPLIVSFAHRNKTVGSALLSRVIEEVRRLDVRFLKVSPVSRNTNAIRFFSEKGFRILSQVELLMDFHSSEQDYWKPGLNFLEFSFRF